MKIVFILCDALRYDYYRKYMPKLNKFAEKKEDHDLCLSCAPFTAESLSYIFCNDKKWSNSNNLIKILKQKGYKTTLIQSSPIFEQYGYNEIFDINIDVFKEEYGRVALDLRKRSKNNIMWKLFRKYILDLGYRRASKVLDYANLNLENNESNSFTWIHLMDTHIPWMPVNLEDYTTKSKVEKIHNKLRANNWKECLSDEEKELIKRLYADECKYLDNKVVDFINKIDYDMLVLTADHGDLLGEYGYYSHPHIPCPELLHVPLIIDNGKRKKVETWYSHIMLKKQILEIVEEKAHNT